MMSRATIVGNVTKKKIKDTRLGEKLAALVVVTTRHWRDKSGEKKQMSSSHNINCFSRVADVVEAHVHVGDLVYIEGEIENIMIKSELEASKWVYCVVGHHIRVLDGGAEKERVVKEKNFNH